MIPVVDIFAGPGGLGEGFSNFRDARDRQPFQLAVSIEKDSFAHATLRLRAFRRSFGHDVPRDYELLVSGELTWEQLAERYPHQAKVASSEALLLELGKATAEDVRLRIGKAVRSDRPWVLIGGPPCQAYSLVGRARNKGKQGYDPDLDHRQTLYVEYLQVLADHAPPIFVMENVKGILSAKLNSTRLFDRVQADLEDPVLALRREGRQVRRGRPRYQIRSLVCPAAATHLEASDLIVRSELYGIPQRRHRVILVGIRSDLDARGIGHLERLSSVSTGQAIDSLPRVRSGLSKTRDSAELWTSSLRTLRNRAWLNRVEPSIKRRIVESIDRLRAPSLDRGADYVRTNRGDVVLNHSTRSHILGDLERYLYASCYAAETRKSPGLADFPASLRPAHRNIQQAVDHNHFGDRFRVQLKHTPSSTITSHISKDGHYYIHYDPTQCRSLTVREAATLQTFPSDYFFCGPRTSQYAQVGNAVPPRLAEQIAAIVWRTL